MAKTKKKKLPKTWEQYFRRESNKYQVLDEFISAQLSEVVESIERDGISGHETLLMLRKVDKEFDYLADSCELDTGWKIKKGWFRSVLIQTCLRGKDTVHFGFTQKVNELYFLLGWSYIDAVEPKASPIEDITSLTWANVDGIAYVDVIIYPTSEFPLGSVWLSGGGNRWEVLDVDGDAIRVLNIEQWGNSREMVLNYKVVRAMERLV